VNKAENKSSEHSEYAVLIPEKNDVEDIIGHTIGAEVHVHHRSRTETPKGIIIEGKRRSVTPIDETRNN